MCDWLQANLANVKLKPRGQTKIDDLNFYQLILLVIFFPTLGMLPLKLHLNQWLNQKN